MTSRIKSQIGLTFILLLSIVINSFSQEKTLDQATFNSIIQSKLDSIYDPQTDFGGATVGIILPDGRKSGFALGYSDVEDKIKMKSSDRMLGGSTGKIFVSASIMQLVENPVTLRQMGIRGRERVEEKFTLDRKVLETEDLCCTLVASTKSGEPNA